MTKLWENFGNGSSEYKLIPIITCMLVLTLWVIARIRHNASWGNGKKTSL